MYRILVIETGEYLYTANDTYGHLYTSHEITIFGSSFKWFRIFETTSQEKALFRLNASANYKLYANTQELSVVEHPEAFEVIEV